MEDGDSYGAEGFEQVPAGDFRSSGFADQHTMIYDFYPNARDIAVQFGSRWSWVGPHSVLRLMNNSNFEAQEGIERAERTFDFDKLPRPSLLARLSGYSDQGLRSYILGNAARRYTSIYDYLGRAPTQEEVDIITSGQANAYRAASQIPGIASIICLSRSLLTARNGQYHLPLPLRVPFNKTRLNFELGIIKIPFTSRVLLTGGAAASLQRAFRSALYVFVGNFLSKPIVLSWLASAEILAITNPRLEEFRDAFTRMLKSQRNDAKSRMRDRQISPVRRRSPEASKQDSCGNADQAPFDPTGQGRVAMSEKWRQHRNSIGAPESRRDLENDAPAGFAASQRTLDTFDRDTQQSADAYREHLQQQQEQRYLDEARSSKTDPTYTEASKEQYSEMSYDSYQGDTETYSRTRPSRTQTQTDSPTQTQTSPSKSGASAWDRVRLGILSADDTVKNNQASSNTSLGNYPDGTPQNNLDPEPQSRHRDSRNQAQDEFDAMLERERAGEVQASDSNKW